MSPAAIIEFLLWLLIAASVIALITSRFRIPYTVALVLGGFAIDLFHLPILSALGETEGSRFLTPDIILILFLPALLFESGININVRQLRENLTPILMLAVAGVVAATVITAYAVHWVVGLPLIAALLFGALISATDPISVLALFKELGVSKRLTVIIEGESLFNDGTSVVIFQIILAAMATGDFSVLSGIRNFLVVVLGGAALGLGMGYIASKATAQVDDPRIEITLTTILAYSSYLIAEHLHVSGVIATVAAGLMIGNFGAETGMTARTRVALWSFWEYVSFVINSLVFLLIGIEVHTLTLLQAWHAILLAIATVLLGRALSVYVLTPVAGLMGEKIPLKWQHVLVWGGLHGSVSMALALSLSQRVPDRDLILTMTFGVVAFSIIAQGLTVKPLLRLLGIPMGHEEEYDRAKVRRIAVSAARRELDGLLRDNLISLPGYQQLRDELEARLQETEKEIESLHETDHTAAEEELRMASARLAAAEKSAIQRSANQGLVSAHTAEKMIADSDDRLDKLMRASPNGHE
jgi:CPA1 family monovalent cation:H+ antiporter